MTDENTPKKRGRKPGSKNSEGDGLPVFLRGRVTRSTSNVKALCEAPDAERYRKYMEYSREAAKAQGISDEELETRFNSVAWNAIWNKDAGFKAWLKQDAAKATEVEGAK